ncbi:MAG: hypothetical protein COC06_03775 [Bacteroidales bacterium]|nr:MAG: hypothetical protein COC06_03775 [Bacteroidales bacterium]
MCITLLALRMPMVLISRSPIMVRASTDVALIMTAYTTYRLLINIIGLKNLMKWAIQQLSYFLELIMLLELKLAKIRTSILFLNKSIFNFYVSFKQLYLNPKWGV